MDSLIDCGKPVCKKLLVTPCLRNYRMDGFCVLEAALPAHVRASARAGGQIFSADGRCAVSTVICVGLRRCSHVRANAVRHCRRLHAKLALPDCMLSCTMHVISRRRMS